jgi:glycosyltransferase involved in cell wall biosynthesis
MLRLEDIDLTADPAARPYVKDEAVDVVFAKTDGELISREGPNRYAAGDALITGSTGDRWSVSRDRFDAKYQPVPPLRHGDDGRYRARPVPVLAKQMTEDFAIARSQGGDLLHGLAGDWLLQYAPGDYGIVENARFARVYRPLTASPEIGYKNADMTAPPTCDISIVIPVYNEEDNLPDLVARVGEAMQPSGFSFELICVDDGSRDRSARVLAQLALRTPWLKPRYLMRNYGQTAALQAGFDAVGGRYTVTLDGDLQNDPLDIPELIRTLEARPEISMISGWRKDRQDKALSRKLPSMLANRLISWATGVRLHDYGCALKAYRSEIVHRIRLYGELHRFVPVLAFEAGAKIVEVPVRHHARTRGVSKYGIDRTFRVLLDLLLMKFMLRYLHRPLHAFGGVGLWMAVPGAGILGYLAILKLLGESIGGRPLLLLGIMLALMGIQLIAIGLLGEILIRIYHEPEGRDQYRLREPPEVE